MRDRRACPAEATDSVEKELKRSGLVLRFWDLALERSYAAEQSAHARPYNRITIPVLIAVVDLFFLQELHAVPEVVVLSAWLRFAVLSPAALLFILLDRRGRLGRLTGLCVVALAVAPTLMTAVESLVTTSAAAVPNLQAGALIQLAVLAWRVSVRQAAAINLLSCTMYIGGICLSPCVPVALLPSMILTDLAIGAAALVFAVRIDLRERQVFLLGLQAEGRRAQLANQNVQLARLSAQDALTGLGNRRCFDEALDAAWSRAECAGTPLALVIFDIDHFKKFNDSHGHQAGDSCLRSVGAAVAGCVREGDTAARYGGEEFAVILPGKTLSAAVAAAERIRMVIENLGISQARGTAAGCVTVSLGVACVIPGRTLPSVAGISTAALLIEAADRCLYAAKEGGRNRVMAMAPPEPVHAADTSGPSAYSAQGPFLSDDP
jgi:diguanylate cyclase (GGDEF)-like protein